MPVALFVKILSKGLPIPAAEHYRACHAPCGAGCVAGDAGDLQVRPIHFRALWNTPVTGDIPTDVLYCLPEWCVFIPTPGKTWQGNRLNGFFVHLDRNHEMRRTELRLVLDVTLPNGDNMKVSLPIIMGRGGVAESLASTLQWSAQPDPLATPMTEQERATAMNEVPSLVSLVLYLCSQNAEIRESGGGDRLPAYPEPKKTKKGPRLFPPDRPTHWEVGYRLGAALRRASTERIWEEPTGTHARRARTSAGLTGIRTGLANRLSRTLEPWY